MNPAPLVLTTFTVAMLGVALGATSPQKPAAPASRTINIVAGDPVDGKMQFSVSRIAAKPGERLRVVLVSTGVQPKAVMGHNFVVLKLGVDPKEFSDDAAVARSTDYIPTSRKGDILALTALVGPGERAEVTFTAPRVPGEYTYLCSFAGHFAAGMSGVLVVK